VDSYLRPARVGRVAWRSIKVGLCAALLVTAGLFLSSYVRLTTIPRSFDIERVLAVDVALPGAKYREAAT
jgi:hypothetical protein